MNQARVLEQKQNQNQNRDISRIASIVIRPASPSASIPLQAIQSSQPKGNTNAPSRSHNPVHPLLLLSQRLRPQRPQPSSQPILKSRTILPLLPRRNRRLPRSNRLTLLQILPQIHARIIRQPLHQPINLVLRALPLQPPNPLLHPNIPTNPLQRRPRNLELLTPLHKHLRHPQRFLKIDTPPRNIQRPTRLDQTPRRIPCALRRRQIRIDDIRLGSFLVQRDAPPFLADRARRMDARDLDLALFQRADGFFFLAARRGFGAERGFAEVVAVDLEKCE